MNTSNTATTTIVASQLTRNNFFLPCVPVSVSANLVATSGLAKALCSSVLEISPTLSKASCKEFAEIQLKKTELRIKTDQCALSTETLLDVCLLNVEDVFSNLTAYLIAQDQVIDDSENQNAQVNTQISLQLVHDYACAVGLATEDYFKDGAIYPEMLFDACIKRVKALQKQWVDNYFQAVELGLQLQLETVFGVAGSCLSEICQDGLENQISIEPMPQVQADILEALATCADFPFSGEWPRLRERVVVFGNQGKDVNADSEGGAK